MKSGSRGRELNSLLAGLADGAAASYPFGLRRGLRSLVRRERGGWEACKNQIEEEGGTALSASPVRTPLLLQPTSTL